MSLLSAGSEITGIKELFLWTACPPLRAGPDVPVPVATVVVNNRI
jgi:hypothetical protein